VSEFFSKDVYEFIKLSHVVESKKSKGGTSFVELERQKGIVKERLIQNEEWIKSRRTHEWRSLNGTILKTHSN
jgi:hypothetical protein